ncbi:GlcG/HbpS family heme-binding protein [Nocardia otitidiscaviarum]|uniref:GlcG/HbpS family heme-binding protein n=1 Tax=Nocardia otitidiscaviarum TaxID=1823 RepID=UPI001893015E|nr:heme-binding protein [Nocardia otitidiscaviarum]MBF6240571.1 heme-binding protein [Nocardia otitidiscaviarum]
MTTSQPTRSRRRTMTGVLTGAVVIAAVGAGAVAVDLTGSDTRPAPSVVLAADASGGNLRQSTHLTVESATRAAQAALATAQQQHQRVSVVVVDRDGNTLVALRGDGAGPQSFESAERKAFTAVSWNAPTSELAGRLQDAPRLADIPGTLFLAGGVPVTADGAPVAGIGVAGAPSGDLDERFARAGVAELSR